MQRMDWGQGERSWEALIKGAGEGGRRDGGGGAETKSESRTDETHLFGQRGQ